MKLPSRVSRASTNAEAARLTVVTNPLNRVIDNLWISEETPHRRCSFSGAQVLALFRFMSRPTASGNETSNPNPSSEGKLRPWPGGSFEDELTRLTARFASIGGSPDLASDLAFQVVLNEIVEQACLATGASGAAVALERDGELQCRASSGETAPELGTPVDANQGLSGECVRTRQVQVCVDAATDLRVDSEASQQLGIRSVIVLPLLRGDQLVGVLEAFSARPGAFGERDQRTLEALAQRVLKSIELAANLAAGREATPSAKSTDEKNENNEKRELSADELSAGAVECIEAAAPTTKIEIPEGEISPVAEILQTRWLRPLSWTLAALSVVIALGLWLRISQRMGWIRTNASAHSASPAHAGNAAGSAANDPAKNDPTANERGNAQAKNSNGTTPTAPASGNQAASSQSPANSPWNDTRAKGTAAGSKAVPVGGLLVYENGKEVFRMLPDGPPAPVQSGLQAEAANQNESKTGQKKSSQVKAGQADPMPGSEIRPASAIEPDVDVPASYGFMRVPENVAEASLAKRVEPEYPDMARQQFIQGDVVLEIRAGVDGAVEHISLISGPPLLADAAITAVARWRFKPELMKGQGKGIVTRITLNFRLPQ
jgi:TonB family protein